MGCVFFCLFLRASQCGTPHTPPIFLGGGVGGGPRTRRGLKALKTCRGARCPQVATREHVLLLYPRRVRGFCSSRGTAAPRLKRRARPFFGEPVAWQISVYLFWFGLRCACTGRMPCGVFFFLQKKEEKRRGLGRWGCGARVLELYWARFVVL